MLKCTESIGSRGTGVAQRLDVGFIKVSISRRIHSRPATRAWNLVELGGVSSDGKGVLLGFIYPYAGLSFDDTKGRVCGVGYRSEWRE